MAKLTVQTPDGPVEFENAVAKLVDERLQVNRNDEEIGMFDAGRWNYWKLEDET